MSIETLKTEIKAVVAAAPSGVLVTAPDLADYLRNNLLPLLEAVVTEVSEQDESIADLVEKASEILHTDSGSVFAALITAGRAIAAELRTRAGNDKRLLTMIKEFGELAEEGESILEDIVIPDTEDDDDEPEETPETPAPVATPATPGAE
jgi:hypothetical protein